MHEIYNKVIWIVNIIGYSLLFVYLALIKEPKDKWLCKAVLVLINTYRTPRLNKVTL